MGGTGGKCLSCAKSGSKVAGGLWTAESNTCLSEEAYEAQETPIPSILLRRRKGWGRKFAAVGMRW